MNSTKKILILFCMLFFAVNSKIIAVEEIESYSIIEGNNSVIQSIYTTNYEEPKAIIKNYIPENNLSLGLLPRKYDSRNILIEKGYDIEEPIVIRNQKMTNMCWIYSPNTAIEINLKLNESKLNMEYDILYTDNETSKIYNKKISNGYGDDYEGGNFFMILNYYLSGKGPRNIDGQIDTEIEDYVIYPSIFKEIENGTVKYYNNSAYSNSRIEYTEEEVINIRNKIKHHIKNYGAVTASIYTYGGTYNIPSENISETVSFFCDELTPNTDHGVTIIGWDDEYSRENFNPENRPINDGAYIVQNSAGKEFSDDGIFYVSYDDYFIESYIFGIENARRN